MKKLRFNLLAKIILLTGALTILTVATSLTVSLLITHKNTKESYIESCEHVTDNIEAIFTENPSKITEIIDLVVENYESIREDYSSKTEVQLEEYQKDLRLSLFGPEGGSFGMTLEKAARKGDYSQAISQMSYICSSFEVPFSSLFLYDVEKGDIISIISSDISYDGNVALIGLRGKQILDEEKEIFGSYLEETIEVSTTVHSYNHVELELKNPNYKCYIQGQYPLEKFNKTFNKQLLTQILLTVGSAFLLVILYALFTKLFLIRNVEKLKKSTNTFVGMMKNDEPLKIVDTNIRTNDEIKDLSDEFMIMQEQIMDYVENIKSAKTKEEAFKADVNVASKIQLESLPADTYFDGNLELRAFIKPAKGVGGDFYDYFYIDEDHLAVVVGDVSGKGIPASLFMMRAKESIQSVSRSERDLAKAFFKVNNSLCLNNKEGFFVTAFLGVLNLKTFEFRYVNAGHEKPFIKHGNECKRLTGESNFVLGIEDEFIYVEEKVQLEEGDVVTLYTDGLNEAINKDKEEFGYERISASLIKDDELKHSISSILNDLEEFSGGEEQFDDITILSFTVKKNVVSYDYLNPTFEDIDDITDKVNAYLDNLDMATLSKIGVVIDEAMNNIISYGKTKVNKVLKVSIEKTDDGAKLIFVDNSHPFNPLLKEKRTVQENMEQGIVGGLGISIIKSISKETEYSYSNNKNILVIKF